VPVEQGEVLSRLWDLFEECCQGQERAAILTGAAGTGKSGLANTFTEKAIAAGAIYCGAVGSRVERALPLGVIGQLFLSADLPAPAREQAERLLADASIAEQASFAGPGVQDQVPAQIASSLGMLLLDLAEATDRPLLIVVDDAQHADQTSLHCLSSVIRRLRRAHAMVLISAASGPQPFDPVFVADLPAPPQTRHMRLGLLPEAGVAEMLAESLGPCVAERLAGDCYRISGGNPALVHGLIDDYRMGVKAQAVPQLTVGPGTSQALLGILHRCDFSMLSMARALAIMDEAVLAAAAGRLVGLDSESAVKAMAALRETGSIAGGRFRDPKLAVAVLDGLAPEEQAVMHARAADILHIDGAPAPVVARHLLAAEGADGPKGAWVVPVLTDAAEQELAGGKPGHALDCLRLAHRISDTGPQRAATQAMLSQAEWRLNPGLAIRHSADLITAIRSGELTGYHALASAGQLLWFGRAAEARDALRGIGESGGVLDQASRAQLAALRSWLAYLFPSVGSDQPADAPGDDVQPTSMMVMPTWQAAQLVTGLARGSEETPTAVEHLLQATSLEHRTFVLLASLVASLACSERTGAADRWCDSLQRDAAAQGATTWQAVFTGLRAVVAYRQGRLVAAEEHARTALTLITARGWGIAVGIPLSVLVQVATAMGKYKEALGHLCTPVPDALFSSPLGLPYLLARGRYYFAREDFGAALRDFSSVADLLAKWDMDMPALIPWRTEAAMTHLRLGSGELARATVTEQLARLGRGHVRERGIALKALAACSDLPKRPGLLRQAAKELQACGDRLELAYALMDLGQAYHALGKLGQARVIRRKAYRTAATCGVTLLGDAVLNGAVPNGAVPNGTVPNRAGAGGPAGDAAGDPGGTDLWTRLSKAERRVAALASEGYSNRQIAGKLFITVSTVEQHLTRVYSKLNLKHRTDLPPGCPAQPVP
jgi:DNA-binding CsgD family transcriptional regulator/tetratricopeptide (TPR) repeat protein